MPDLAGRFTLPGETHRLEVTGSETPVGNCDRPIFCCDRSTTGNATDKPPLGDPQTENCAREGKVDCPDSLTACAIDCCGSNSVEATQPLEVVLIRLRFWKKNSGCPERLYPRNMESPSNTSAAFTPLSLRATYLRERAKWTANVRKASRIIERGSSYFLPTFRYGSFAFFLIALYLLGSDPSNNWTAVRIFLGLSILCFLIWYPLDRSMGKSFEKHLAHNRLLQERADQGYDVNRPGDVHRSRLEQEARELGLEAEQLVARILDQAVTDIGDELRVMHSLKKDGGGDIDHVIYGPFGVLIIETKANRAGPANADQLRNHQSWFHGRFGQPSAGVACVAFQTIAPHLIDGIVETGAHRLDEVVVGWHAERKQQAGVAGRVS